MTVTALRIGPNGTADTLELPDAPKHPPAPPPAGPFSGGWPTRRAMHR